MKKIIIFKKAQKSSVRVVKKAVEHTPGPWRVNGMSLRIVDLIGATICVPPEPLDMMTDAEFEQWRADGLLVAAAPEMLEALEETFAAHQRQDPHPEDACSICPKARAAIAKARGL